MIKQTYPACPPFGVEQCRGIKLRNKKVNYTLKTSKRAKRMRLAVYCDGTFIVTRPRGLSENIVERLIIQKSNWIIEKLEYFKKFGVKIFKDDYAQYLAYKEEALIFTEDRVKRFNKLYKFKYNKINIKNQKTRWGSCSRRSNLNFNYKILFLTENAANYIIVHELCHLKEFSHSHKFWNLVAKAVPKYLEIKKELKNKGLSF